MKLVKVKVKQADNSTVTASINRDQIKMIWEFPNGLVIELLSGEKIVVDGKSKKQIEDDAEGI